MALLQVAARRADFLQICLGEAAHLLRATQNGHLAVAYLMTRSAVTCSLVAGWELMRGKATEEFN